MKLAAAYSSTENYEGITGKNFHFKVARLDFVHSMPEPLTESELFLHRACGVGILGVQEAAQP